MARNLYIAGIEKQNRQIRIERRDRLDTDVESIDLVCLFRRSGIVGFQVRGNDPVANPQGIEDFRVGRRTRHNPSGTRCHCCGRSFASVVAATGSDEQHGNPENRKKAQHASHARTSPSFGEEGNQATG